MCTHTASRIVRYLGQLLEDRSRIDAVESEAVEARAFVAVADPGDDASLRRSWLLGAPIALKISYTVLCLRPPGSADVQQPGADNDERAGSQAAALASSSSSSIQSTATRAWIAVVS